MAFRATVVAVLLVLVACGPSDDLIGTIQTAKAAETELREDLGLVGTISVSKQNGRLSQVTVLIDGSGHDGRTAEELVLVVEPILVKHFGEKPESTIVKIEYGDAT